MLESPSSLESSRDPFTGALWWTESSFDGSPCRNNSFARVNGSLRRLKESNDRSRELDLSMDGARKKLTWISREDHRSSSSRNLASNERLSIQNGSMHVVGRSARFGGTDSPRRLGIHSPAESPARRGESVRRIRTPSVDFDTTEVPSSATASRRLRSLNHAPRSASFKEGSAVAGAAASAVAKTDHEVVKEASAVWKGLTSTAVGRDQRNAPKPRVPHPTRDEPYSPRVFPSSVRDSPESDRIVVSYLAEETDRIIKERIQKLKLRYHSNAADQLRTTNHERSSGGAQVMMTNGSGRRLPSRHYEKTKAQRGSQDTYDMDRDQVRVGDPELDDESSNSPACSMPGSPSLPISPFLPQYNSVSTIGEGRGHPPTRKISPTMENYLKNRRSGSNTSPQIIVPPRQIAAPILSPAASSRSNIFAVLRQPAEEPENPSTSSSVNYRVGRYESFTATPRAALSPINGNEDVTHSTPSLSQRKGELPIIAGGDPNIRVPSQRKELTDSQKIAQNFPESVQQAENGFPSRLEHWADFLGNGVEMDSGESHSSQFTQQSVKRATSDRKLELGTKIAPVRVHSSNGGSGGGHSSQKERRPLGGSARHLAAGARDLLSVGSGDKHNASRRSQSCRRDSLIKSLLDSPPAASRKNPSALPSGHDTSSNSKNSSRSSVNMKVRSSGDTLPKPSPIMSQIEKQRFLSPNLSDHMSSPRRISIAAPESRGTPFSSSRKSSVAGHEPGGNPRSSSRRLSVGLGHEAGAGNPLSRARSYSVAAGRELGGSPLVSYSEPLEGSKSPILMQIIDKAKHLRMGTASLTKSSGPHMDSPIRDPQLGAKKNNAVQLERPKTSHKGSLSLDQQDIYKRLFVQTKSKDSQNGQPLTTSTSVSQVCREVCSMPSSMTAAKPQRPSSPVSSFQRWFANQFKVGSKARSSSAAKDRDPQEEPKLRTKSPWRTRPAEILQGLTRKKGTSTRPPAVLLFDPNSVQTVQHGSSFDSDSASQSPMSASDPWHDRMMYTEFGCSTPHRKSYALPSISTMSPISAMSPAPTTKGLQGMLKKNRSHH